MKENESNFRVISSEQSRVYLDTVQIYDAYREVAQELLGYRGGMHWKKARDKEYLFRTRDRFGNGSSLGARSTETEAIYQAFHSRKQVLTDRQKSLAASLRKQARMNIALDNHRVPKVAANIIRLLDANGLMGNNLTIIGTNCLYAYEVACGVQIREPALLATQDMDVLMDSSVRLRLLGNDAPEGILGMLQKADKSFEKSVSHPYRAVNKNGFMFEIVKPIESMLLKGETGLAADDLVAVEIESMDWLRSSRKLTRTVIADDGLPVRFVVPDPRVFAIHKLWLSEKANHRRPEQRIRDKSQAEAVLSMIADLPDFSLESDDLKILPAEFVERAKAFIAESDEDEELNLGPGF